MIRRRYRKETGLGTMVALSAIVHLALYFFLVYYHFPAFPLKQEVTYYVDVVNLPVAYPQAGSPASPPAAAPTPAPAKSPEMRQPEPPSLPGTKSLRSPTPQAAPQESGREIEDRIRSIQRKVEESRQSAALDDLRKRVSGRERAGVPGGTGTEAGSDYANYIQARLKNALDGNISYQSRNPEVVVRLTIGRNGKVVNYVVEKSTDRVFEEVVALAVSRAEKTFPPPPGNREFVQGFIFKPKEVVKK
ncbi:MAG: TonB family protein [Geobacter sp.]|nr:TonB family protein [Geobacter sp.]